MTQEQKDQRRIALTMSGGLCEVCCKPLERNAQAAHRIGNTIANRAKFGSIVIDDPLNVGYVCSLACNASLDISMIPAECDNLALKIFQKRVKKYIKNT